MSYSSIVGKIGWPAKSVRPDLSQSYSMLSRALSSPQPSDARTLRKILQYIYHHQDEPLVILRPDWFIPYVTPLELIGFSDSNYARAAREGGTRIQGVVPSWVHVQLHVYVLI